MTTATQNEYMLGHSPDEIQRLIFQGSQRPRPFCGGRLGCSVVNHILSGVTAR
jgi:hypothetical protein